MKRTQNGRPDSQERTAKLHAQTITHKPYAQTFTADHHTDTARSANEAGWRPPDVGTVQRPTAITRNRTAASSPPGPVDQGDAGVHDAATRASATE